MCKNSIASRDISDVNNSINGLMVERIGSPLGLR